MTRMQRLLDWFRMAVTLPERQCQAVLIEAMRRAGWKPATRLRMVRRKR